MSNSGRNCTSHTGGFVVINSYKMHPSDQTSLLKHKSNKFMYYSISKRISSKTEENSIL